MKSAKSDSASRKKRVPTSVNYVVINMTMFMTVFNFFYGSGLIPLLCLIILNSLVVKKKRCAGGDTSGYRYRKTGVFKLGLFSET